MRIFQTFHTVSTLVFTRLQFIQFAAITLRQLHSTQLLVFFILLKFPLAAAAELLSQNSGHVETIKALYKFKGRLFWFLNNFGLQKWLFKFLPFQFFFKKFDVTWITLILAASHELPSLTNCACCVFLPNPFIVKLFLFILVSHFSKTINFRTLYTFHWWVECPIWHIVSCEAAWALPEDDPWLEVSMNARLIVRSFSLTLTTALAKQHLVVLIAARAVPLAALSILVFVYHNVCNLYIYEI